MCFAVNKNLADLTFCLKRETIVWKRHICWMTAGIGRSLLEIKYGIAKKTKVSNNK